MFIFVFACSLCCMLEATNNKDEPLSNQVWSQFGPLRHAYVAGRKEKPQEVFNILRSYVSLDARILDLGAGTGISTRQLFKNGFKHVIGVDRDFLMLEEARAANTKPFSIKYLQGDVGQGLPFPDAEFDVVTAFSAFHWFANPSSIHEVKRLLKPGGYYFIVGANRYSKEQKPDNPLSSGIKKIIEEAIGQKLPKKNVDSLQDLESQGFKIILNARIPYIHQYTKEEYLESIQSHSYWNFIRNVPPQVQQKVLRKIERFVNSFVDENGHIQQEGIVVVILAQSPESSD
ncbi:class I SAM-dependent methyltransferase [Candidatus Protochlamydia phocaeensis]|uniref:class I SAM-dependent methyltransferase n=1 Tax=Candidatus Protochlamydia phocaeensis TaxID=1414722 RepID=UPI0018967140|nr:class I SAM-dependent methyltransferase [Candidatus Protochlamydia phocaeensis]